MDPQTRTEIDALQKEVTSLNGKCDALLMIVLEQQSQILELYGVTKKAATLTKEAALAGTQSPTLN